MDLKQIRYFQRIFTTGSFSAASRAEHIAQPALSLQMQRLEAELGVSLFERHSSGITPTKAGMHFFDLSQRIMNEVNVARSEMALHSDAVSGKLNLGLPPSANLTVLRHFLPGYVERFPNVDITLREAYSGMLSQWVYDGTLDFAIGMEPVDRTGLSIRSIHREPMMLAGKIPGVEKNFSAIRIQDLPPLKIVLPLPEHMLCRKVIRQLQQANVTIERLMYLDGYVATLEMVRHSDWCTITSLCVLMSEIRSEQVNVHPLLEADLDHELYVVQNRTNPLSAAAVAMIRAVEEGFRLYREECSELLTKRFPGWENQMLGEPKAQFDCNSISADTRRGKLRPATNGVGSIDIHDSNFG